MNIRLNSIPPLDQSGMKVLGDRHDRADLQLASQRLDLINGRGGIRPAVKDPSPRAVATVRRLTLRRVAHGKDAQPVAGQTTEHPQPNLRVTADGQHAATRGG